MGGQQARGQAHSDDDEHDDAEGQRIGGGDALDLAGEEARKGKAHQQPEENARGDEAHAVAQDHLKHFALLRAERLSKRRKTPAPGKCGPRSRGAAAGIWVSRCAPLGIALIPGRKSPPTDRYAELFLPKSVVGTLGIVLLSLLFLRGLRGHAQLTAKRVRDQTSIVRLLRRWLIGLGIELRAVNLRLMNGV